MVYLLLISPFNKAEAPKHEEEKVNRTEKKVFFTFSPLVGYWRYIYVYTF
jgi:hypothetical protein